MSADFDLLIRAGRMFCAASKYDGPGAVGICGDRIVAAGADVSGSARETLDFPDDLLLPGLVDLHAHPALRGSRYGVDPDVEFLPRGVTTVMSQGDAGALNWNDYRREVVEGRRTRVLMALGLSKYGESQEEGCFVTLDDADVDACASTVSEGGDALWGIAFNTAEAAIGDLDHHEIMRRGLAAAEACGRPILYGARWNEDWPLAQQLELLRPGDVVTYCLTPFPENLVADGRVVDCVWQARERGVLFDAGHGMRSFSFPVAEAMFAEGFLPDTISTDQYNKHVGGNPQHDLPRMMSKLIAAGMEETDAFERATARSAQHLGLGGEVGTLAVGACADVAVLHWNAEAAPLVDSDGEQRPGGCWEPVQTVRAGKPA
jgi:dihydroorotase